MANLDDQSSPTSGLNEAARSARSAAGEQLKAAEGALKESGRDISEKAGLLVADVKDAALDKAESAKQGLGGGISTLGGALRAAGDHLAENGQAGSSKLIGEAASGLERFADSLNRKPLGEVFDELRTFGQNNAGGLFIGSMLAGLALGRLFASAGSDNASGGRSSSAVASHGSENANENDFGVAPGSSTSAPPVTASSGYAL